MTLIEQGVIALVLSLGIAVLGYCGAKHMKNEGYQEAVVIYQKQVADQKKLTDAATAQLAANKLEADKEKDEALKANDAKYAAVVSSLQQRASRTETSKTGSGAITSTASSCTGVGLYRDDAEFLVGFAKHAADVQVERDYYYERYESARKLLAGESTVGGQQGTVSDAESVSGIGVQP